MKTEELDTLFLFDSALRFTCWAKSIALDFFGFLLFFPSKRCFWTDLQKIFVCIFHYSLIKTPEIKPTCGILLFNH